MARTTIAVQTLERNAGAGITYTAADSANGMQFVNDGGEIAIVKNGSGGSITATFHSVPDASGRLGDIAQIITAGTDAIIGPLRPGDWNQTSGVSAGDVTIDFTASASVNIAIVKLPA